MFIIFIPVYLFLFIPLRLVIAGETDGFIRSAGVINWVAMITIFSLSHVAFLMQLPAPKVGHGLGYVLSLVIMTALNDVFQFIWGKLLGGPKIIPKVSPGKTWAGFLGGVGSSALLASFLLPLLTPYSPLVGAGVGALLAGCGFIGDLVESAVKRDIGVKDSGESLPGHGGILDRVDSLTYTAPVFFHLTFYLFH
jgi:phosphatidate cytidylyltransferase